MIVVVEDNEPERTRLTNALGRLHPDVRGFANGDEAYRAVKGGAIDLLVADLHLEQGGGRGSELLLELRGVAAYTVLVSGDPHIQDDQFRRFADQVQQKQFPGWVDRIVSWAAQIFRTLPSDADTAPGRTAFRPLSTGVPAGHRIYVLSSPTAYFVGPDPDRHDFVGLFALGGLTPPRRAAVDLPIEADPDEDGRRCPHGIVVYRGRAARIRAAGHPVRLLARYLDVVVSNRKAHYYGELQTVVEAGEIPPQMRSASTNLWMPLADAFAMVGAPLVGNRPIPDSKNGKTTARFDAAHRPVAEWRANDEQEVYIDPALRARNPENPLCRVQIVLDDAELKAHEAWRSVWSRTWEVHP